MARAELRRVEALVGFARIVAPYDGVVTRRNVDTGYMTAPGVQGEPLFIVRAVRPGDRRRRRPRDVRGGDRPGRSRL